MVNITTDSKNEVHTIAIDGEVDASSSIFLDDAIGNALEEDWKKLIIDCSKLNYISSAGLGVFMSYLEEINAREIKLVIFGLNEKVHNVFQILGLDQLLAIVESEEEAKTVIHEV